MSDGGTNYNLIVNNYGTGNAPTSSGQQPGDDGPAPASSSPSPGDDKDKGSASGGQDCNTPPVCQGDAPTCMVVSQQWLTRCKPDWYDKDGDGEPDWVGKGMDLPGVGVPDPVDPTSVVSSDDGASVGSIDQSSWAGTTCPQLPDLELFGKSITYGDQAMFCDWLAKLRAVFLLVGAFVAARILASGGKS
jgi:hypothetical protein